MSADTLQQAYRLIREGKKPEAVRLLVPIARAEPRNADAWWLLANALEDPDKQRRAVERVLLLRPDDARAQKLLDRLPSPLDDPFAEVDFDQVDAAAVPDEDADDEFPPEAAVTGASVSDPVSAVLSDDDDDEFPPEVLAPADDDDEFPPEASVSGIPVAASKRTAEHEFPPVDAYEPYDEVPLEARRVRVHRSRRGASPITLVLAAIGLITVLSCGLCLVASLVSIPTIQRVVGEVIQTVTYEPGFATLVSFATPASGASTTLNDPLPADLNRRGNINLGQTLRASVDTFKDDAWAFTGEANQRVIIELDATDAALDPQLYLYDSDNREIAANDDIAAGNNNARIEITLPYSGSYTIRVSAFGSGGGYELTVRAG